MLLTKQEVQSIWWEWSRFSKLFDSKSKEYDYFLFHRKFKVNLENTIVSTNKERNPIYILRFTWVELKELFDKKKKKNWENSEFIRIRFKWDTASFKLWNGKLVDITGNIIRVIRK